MSAKVVDITFQKEKKPECFFLFSNCDDYKTNLVCSIWFLVTAWSNEKNNIEIFHKRNTLDRIVVDDSAGCKAFESAEWLSHKPYTLSVIQTQKLVQKSQIDVRLAGVFCCSVFFDVFSFVAPAGDFWVSSRIPPIRFCNFRSPFPPRWFFRPRTPPRGLLGLSPLVFWIGCSWRWTSSSQRGCSGRKYHWSPSFNEIKETTSCEV